MKPKRCEDQFVETDKGLMFKLGCKAEWKTVNGLLRRQHQPDCEVYKWQKIK